MDSLVVVALLLLVVGVVGSVLPLVPGPLASLGGLLLYWWATGYAEPGPLAMVALVLFGFVALAAEYFSGPIAARAGGASYATTAVAAVVGVALFFVTGPVGIVLGIGGTVFAVEFYRNQDAEASLRTAAYATVGVLASTAVQLVVTLAILAVVVLYAFV